MAELTQQQYNELIQRGLSPERIDEVAKQRGFSLPSGGVEGVPGVALGVGKGALGIARGTTQILQSVGQRALSGISGEPLEKIRATTGFESLDESKPAGAAVSEMLRRKGTAEKLGGAGVEIASFFLPVAGGVGIAGRVSTAAGRQVSKLGVPLGEMQADLIQAYRARTPVLERMALILRGESKRPITDAETALRQNLFGTRSMVGVQARKGAQTLWQKTIAPALKNVKETVNFPSFIKEVETSISSEIDPSRKRALIEALDAFKSDFKSVKNIDYTQLQKFKEGWTEFLPDKVWKGKPVGAAFREVQNIASQLARNKIGEKIGLEGKAAYIDYGNLKNLQAMGKRAMTGPLIHPGGAGTLLSDLTQRTIIPITTTGGLTLYRLGKGLEFIGRPGLKFLGEIFGL